MEYKDFKNGDVIVFKICSGNEMIAIFNKIETNICGDLELHTYAELFEDYLLTECETCGGFYLVGTNVTDFRYATDDEKEKIYNAISKYYTEEYNNEWYNHFNDSSYFKIRDFLLEVFCIKVEEYDNDLLYPDFVNEIHKFIWDKSCAKIETNYNYVKSDVAMVNKSEFIAKLKRWLELETNWNMQYIESGKNPNFGKIDELINYMEEII